MPTPPTDDSVLTPDVDPLADARPVESGAPDPDIGRTARAVESAGRSVGITVLAVLALLYTLYFARDFLLPVTFAVLLNFLLSPVVRALTRLHVPPPLGAGIVIIALLGTLALGVYELADPVQRWVGKAPATMDRVGTRVRRILLPVERVSKTAEQVAAVGGPSGPPPRNEVVIRGPSIVSRVFGTTQRLLAGLLEVIILLYSPRAAGDLYLHKLITVLPNLDDKLTAVQIARRTEASISTYLLTAALVNALEGTIVSGAMFLLGMPNVILWGALCFFLEFVPYLGAATMTLVLLVAALTTFDNTGRALLVPATFLAINLIQANFVSPLLLSKRLTLNPVAIFVGLAFWWWIWGVPGAFIAVPLIATFKIFCDHIESLAPIGVFLGKRDVGERRTTVRIEDPAATHARSG
jgi:predicted PurR-regulated permease PerM